MGELKIRAIEPNMQDEFLRTSCREVVSIGTAVMDLVADMKTTLRKFPGVGLSAPQVSSDLRVILISIPDLANTKQFDNEGMLVLINPKILEKSGKRVAMEACLSIPNWFALKNRATKVKVKALDVEGNPIYISGRNLLAQVLEHEIDHINGILFTDKTIKTFPKDILQN